MNRDEGGEYRPTHVGDIAPHGILSCGNELFCDPDALTTMEADGIVAVDMETAAVAAVCDRAGVPWSVLRGISDFAGDGIVDQQLFEATRPDGTADPEAIARYLEAHPEKLPALAQLAQDSNLATEAAAAAAVRACADLST